MDHYSYSVSHCFLPEMNINTIITLQSMVWDHRVDSNHFTNSTKAGVKFQMLPSPKAEQLYGIGWGNSSNGGNLPKAENILVLNISLTWHHACNHEGGSFLKCALPKSWRFVIKYALMDMASNGKSVKSQCDTVTGKVVWQCWHNSPIYWQCDILILCPCLT